MADRVAELMERHYSGEDLTKLEWKFIMDHITEYQIMALVKEVRKLRDAQSI